MDTVPHIDIVEPERIAALLADPRNFAWRAVNSETLDTWTPDLGLTSYPHPSIYRPAGVAQSGMSSTLRHRFWGTIERQSDHTGWRYIGMLLYAAAGEPCPLEVQLAADAIGRVEPHRLDNRRHLIVLDKAVRFIGEMEVFQLTAPGPGAYRIEQFVLLRERPQPSRFVPHIERLTAATQRQVDGLYQADFHFITSEIAAVQVQFESGNQVVRGDQPATYHHLTLSDLPANTTWTARVTATDRDGETDVQTVTFQTQTPAVTPPADLTLPVELMNPGAGDFTGLPLTFGMPLAEGILFEPPPLQLETPQAALPVQTCVHARWPDQSARWMLVDTQIPPDLAQTRTIQAHIRPRSQALNTVPRLTHQFNARTCQVASDQLRVTVETGGSVMIEQRRDDQWDVLLPALNFGTVLGSGLALQPGPLQALTLEEAGDYRTVIRCTVPHHDAAGTTHLLSTLRLHVYAGQSFIRLIHRLGVVSPSANDGPETSTLLPLRSLTITLPWPGAEVVHALDSSWPLASGWQLQQTHDLAYTLTHNDVQTTHVGRASGHIRIAGTTGTLGVGIRRFWQTYPQALRVTAEGVQIQLFPELPDAPLPGDEDAWHRLYFWLKNGAYLLKAGMNLTSEVLLDFDGTDAAVFHWLEQPVLARPDVDYLNTTGALNPIAPKAGSRLPAYETLVDEALASFYADREAWRAYGHVNFGDWYGESGWSWGNNEYDTAYCAYTEFLRGGDSAWATWGTDAVRHLVDVDTLNFAADSSAIGGQAMHMPGHLGGYLPPLFRSKMGSTKSIPSHTWVEGPLLHYLLTGDESVRETIEKTKRWLLDRHWFDYYDFSNCRESGWHIIHLCMLARATNDPDCLNAAAIIVRRVLEREAPGGGWVRMLTESHCGCGYPRCQGEAGFMVGVLLSGLKRYYHLTSDERVAQAIISGARWLIQHTYDEKVGHFRYTSCANRTHGGGYQQTQWVLEGLADAYEISGDPEIGSYVQNGLSAIGRFPEGLGHSGLGKALAQQMRYVPTLLHALQKRPL
jgi:hypothetical protein